MSAAEAPPSGVFDRLLERFGIDARQFRALTQALILMDLRSQHFTAATGTQPRHLVSPLFWVVGQCFTMSAIASLVLFLRVDLYMYAFIGIFCSTTVLATTVLVEFHEVIFHPQDLTIVGPRPVSARTYAAARFANLLFYVVMMYGALNLFPAIVGMGMDDAGPWYLPAYLVASLTGGLLAVCLVIIVFAELGDSDSAEGWKSMLAWTQIVLTFIAVYGGQLIFRNADHKTEVWMTFPPDWIHWLPMAWLASFVDQACDVPSFKLLGLGVLMLVMTGAACVLAVQRVRNLYEHMQPVEHARPPKPMLPERIGTLVRPGAELIARSREELIGLWLCTRALRKDSSLRMRCLYPLNMALAVILLGIGTGQFENPLQSQQIDLVLLPILSVYLIALSVPVILLNLTWSDAYEAFHVVRTAPLENPSGIAVGGGKSVMLWVVTPLCVMLFVVDWIVWRDVAAAGLHAGLAWMVSWITTLASLWLVVPDYPLSQPAARGSGLGPAVIPLAMFSGAASLLGGLHFLFASTVWFWAVAAVVGVVGSFVLKAAARKRLNLLLNSMG